MGEQADKVADLLEGLVAALNEAGISYALCGGWAAAFWGHQRLTTDIDLLLDEDSMDRAREMLEPIGFHFDQAPATNLSNGVHVAHASAAVFDKSITLDVYPVASSDGRLQRKGWVAWRGLEVPVIDIEDLIDMKENSQRPKDRGDVEELRRIQSEKAAH